jgi:predicted transcriptional regulator
MTTDIYTNYKDNLPTALTIMDKLSRYGVSQALIADAFGLTPAAVHYHLRLKSPKKIKPTREEIRQLGLLLVNGIKETEAA